MTSARAVSSMAEGLRAGCGGLAIRRSDRTVTGRSPSSSYQVTSRSIGRCRPEAPTRQRDSTGPVKARVGPPGGTDTLTVEDAWQQSRQVLMRWVTILAAGYALSQMLAYADPARTPGLASPAPWRPPGTRTAGLIRAGLARLLRRVGPPALTPAIARKSDRRTGRHIGRRTPAGAEAA